MKKVSFKEPGSAAVLVHKAPVLTRLNRSKYLYLLLLPTIIYLIIFKYWPMYGVQIAFRDFSPVDGIWGSKWVGLQHFARFFRNYDSERIITNTIVISVTNLVCTFPLSIILALMINQVVSRRFKRFVQTVSYAPYFISVVVLVGIISLFTQPSSGLINQIIVALGGKSINFQAEKSWFLPLYIISGIWQGTGWGTIIYLAGLSSVDRELYEAADMDGASKLRKVYHIDLPTILPTISVLLIFAVGGIMNVGFDKIFLMQNSLNTSVSEVISTFVYKQGIIRSEYSYASAVGLFNTVINFILLLIVNRVSRRLTGMSIL